MKIKELESLNKDELLNKIKQFKKELFDLNAQRQLGGRVEKPAQFRAIKKDIARIMTLLSVRSKNEKQR